MLTNRMLNDAHTARGVTFNDSNASEAINGQFELERTAPTFSNRGPYETYLDLLQFFPVQTPAILDHQLVRGQTN